MDNDTCKSIYVRRCHEFLVNIQNDLNINLSENSKQTLKSHFNRFYHTNIWPAPSGFVGQDGIEKYITNNTPFLEAGSGLGVFWSHGL